MHAPPFILGFATRSEIIDEILFCKRFSSNNSIFSWRTSSNNKSTTTTGSNNSVERRRIVWRERERVRNGGGFPNMEIMRCCVVAESGRSRRSESEYCSHDSRIRIRNWKLKKRIIIRVDELREEKKKGEMVSSLFDSLLHTLRRDLDTVTACSVTQFFDNVPTYATCRL